MTRFVSFGLVHAGFVLILALTGCRLQGMPPPPPPDGDRYIESETLDGSASSGWTSESSDALVVFENERGSDFDTSELDRILTKYSVSSFLGPNYSLLVTSYPVEDADAVALAEADRRATLVRDYIVSQGFAPERVSTVGHGEVPVDWNSPDRIVRVKIEKQESRLSYYWNTWTHPSDASWLEPSQELEPDSSYGIVIDLSAFEYGRKDVDSYGVEKRFAGLVREQAAQGKATLELEVVLVTDGKLKVAAGERPQKLVIDLERIRQLEKGTPTQPTSVFDSLAEDPRPGWVFGRLRFAVETTKERGWTSFGLSFWHKARPFDELVFQRCVGEIGSSDCDPAKRPNGTSFGGGELFEVARDSSQSRPDAALHLIELSGDKLVGVFARNKPGEHAALDSYVVWSIPRGAADFAQSFEDLQARVPQAVDAPIRIGEGFTNLVFPQRQPDADRALEALKLFLAETAPESAFGPNRPILFVRMLSNLGVSTPLYPLGLLNVGGEKLDFLGYRTQIQSPLAEQGYGKRPCPNTWEMLLPMNSSDRPLASARMAFAKRVVGIKASELQLGATSIPIVTAIGDFANWIGPRRGSAEYKSGYPATVLTTVSHHSDDSLYFTVADPILAENVTANFQGDSIAILAGCTTGQPGPGGFVHQLNQAGFRTVIATSTGVDGELAGAVVNAMAAELESAGGPLAIGELFARTQRALHESGAFSHSVLSLTLVGNPEAEICLPR